MFLVLDVSEQETNSFVITRQTELEEIAALLDQLHRAERLGQGVGTLEPILQSVHIVYQVRESHGARPLLEDQIAAETLLFHLVEGDLANLA